MCYGISQAYKESANCRLERQYAHERELDAIPLMMEQGYKPNGWLVPSHNLSSLAYK